jgi:hypothetical protein
VYLVGTEFDFYRFGGVMTIVVTLLAARNTRPADRKNEDKKTRMQPLPMPNLNMKCEDGMRMQPAFRCFFQAFLEHLSFYMKYLHPAGLEPATLRSEVVE